MIKKRVRIINKQRFMIFISLIVVLIVFTIITIIQPSVRGIAENKYTEIYVYEGDTLWEIAQQYDEKYKDIRNFIDKIMLENNMESAMLIKGETIKIPID